MGKIYENKTGNLYFDFNYHKIRCREHTKLKNSPVNKKRMEAVLARIEAEITLNQFDYGKTFPNSKKINEIKEMESRLISKDQNSFPDFNTFACQWFDEMAIGWRRSYQETIRQILNNRLIPEFGTRIISEISKTDILQFRSTLGEIRNKKGKGLAPATINRQVKTAVLIISEAAERFEFNFKLQRIKALPVPKNDIKPFSLTEINLIIDTVREDFRNYYIIRFYSGMRTGEIDGLQWKYVDFEKREILIRETIIDGRIEYTKTDSSQREIKMITPVYDAFKAQLKQTKHSKFVFCNSLGNPLNYHNIAKRVWYPILSLLGLERRNPYQSRHTAATLMLASGESPEFVARQLGHASTLMLFNVYSRYIPNATRRDSTAFNKLVSEFANKESSR